MTAAAAAPSRRTFGHTRRCVYTRGQLLDVFTAPGSRQVTTLETVEAVGVLVESLAHDLKGYGVALEHVDGRVRLAELPS